MNKEIKVANANNIPVQFPLYADPKVPYECPGNRTLTVVCKTDPEIIKKYLEPTPFEYVDNYYHIYIGDFSGAETGAYWDAAIVIPVRYKDIVGGHFLVEFEDQDYSIAAGRELWVYPKKYGKCRMEETDEKIIAVCEKNGIDIIKLEMDKTKKLEQPLKTLKLHPHIQMQVIGRAERAGVALKRILTRDSSSDYVLESCIEHPCRVELQSVDRCPVADFTPEEILGGRFVIGNHRISDEHGWATVIDTLINEF
ncbi:MAG: acetoacetate decarboxylase family protein [Phascolarctobacterium sp.]|nr:acetoacetate decarboxylase family protein [Phascolarctobacterium sp.]